MILVSGGFVCAWVWQANAYGMVIATNEASYQADRALIANAASAQARDALAKQQDAEQKLAALDKTATEQRDKANAENDLCAALWLTALAGCGSQAPAQLVPVAATCPTPPAPPA